MNAKQTSQPDTAKRPLPPGWRWVRLGEVCNIVIGRTPSRSVPEYWGGDLPWVTISDLNDGYITFTNECITRLGAAESGSRLIKAGTILFSFKLTIGKMGLAAIDVYTNEAIAALLPKSGSGLSKDFLWYSLKFINPSEGSAHAVKGITLNQETLQAIEIPLPPLSEQQRIAAMLREQMDAVERARRAAEEQLQAAKALPAAYLRAVFPKPGEPLPPGWRWVRLGEVCRQDRTIIEPKSPQAVRLPYLSLEHIESNTGRILTIPSEPMSDEGRSTTFAFDSRHILYGKLRPYLNKVALPEFSGRCTTEIIPLLPVEGVNREFLCWLLRRQETVEAAMRSKTGSRMPRADMDELMKLILPLPPLAEQRRIAAILCEQMEGAERLRKALEEQLEAINKLPAALLRRAFNGEL